MDVEGVGGGGEPPQDLIEAALGCCIQSLEGHAKNVSHAGCNAFWSKMAPSFRVVMEHLPKVAVECQSGVRGKAHATNIYSRAIEVLKKLLSQEACPKTLRALDTVSALPSKVCLRAGDTGGLSARTRLESVLLACMIFLDHSTVAESDLSSDAIPHTTDTRRPAAFCFA